MVAITSADQVALEGSIRQALNGAVPLVRWDCVNGAFGLNEPGQSAFASLGVEPIETIDAVALLTAALKLPASSILLLHHANRMLDNAAVVQAFSNLRDAFKSNQRMAVLLGDAFVLPSELRNDVLIFDEALPDREQARSIINTLTSEAGVAVADEVIGEAAEALIGLSAFAIEQNAAMSLSKEGIDIDTCWARKKKQVEQTPGLKMQSATVSFNDVGGLQAAKDYFTKLFNGPKSPRLIVRLEEVEKLMAGSSGAGDNTGVSQDFLQVLLNEIESNGWLGALFLGPGGSGKSYFSEAMAGQFRVRSILMDTGAMKTSALGESEKNIRSGFQTIKAISTDRVIVVATCNGLAELKPELQRRLASAGMWYFELPDTDEKPQIWRLQCGKFGLEADACPVDKGWSSSDIRDCCRTAYLLGESLVEASVRVNCAMNREPERIESLRRLATGRLSSASYLGPYRYQSTATIPLTTGRTLDLKGGA